jgi:hypothetical protein
MNLLIVGFNRSFSHCWPSIQEKWLPHTDKVFYCVSRTKNAIKNERSGEDGQGEWDLGIDASAGLYLDQAYVDEQCAKTYKIALNAGVWQRWTPETLHNLVRYLYVISRAAWFVPAERTAVIRCDMLHHDDIDPGAGNIFPAWHNWAGLNDRVAILEPDALQAYLRRYDRVKEYIGKGNQLHSERFLKWAMGDFHYTKVDGMKASRVRVGGKVKEEKFERGR